MTKSVAIYISAAIVIGLTIRAACAQSALARPDTLHAAVESSIPAYRPQPASPPKGAGYLLSDGSVQIVGFDDMNGILASLNALFVQSHPGVRFKDVSANNLATLHALVFDATAFAPVGSEFLGAAGVPYQVIVHAEPFGIRIAHGSLNPNAKVSPLAIIVNKSNPVENLTADQVTHIFTVGGRKPDIIHWSQVGVKGEWGTREIHSCGLPESDHYPSEDPSFGEYMFVHKMGGHPSAWNYEMAPNYLDVVQKVSADPSAIGITALNRVSANVKVVGIIANDWASPTRGTAEEIVAGKYPYDRYLYIYVRRIPGQPMDPFVKEYLRLVLSREGQQAIGAEAHGYLPLNAREVAEELAKIEE